MMSAVALSVPEPILSMPIPMRIPTNFTSSITLFLPPVTPCFLRTASLSWPVIRACVYPKYSGSSARDLQGAHVPARGDVSLVTVVDSPPGNLEHPRKFIHR